MFKQADNYLKLTVRTERTVRDYIQPFRSSSESEATDALATVLGMQLHAQRTSPDATCSISVFDATPFQDDAIATIGDWHPDDLQADEPAALH